ncbi:DNA polymerase III subunit beta [Eubacterium sp. MSJ-33]|uniref:DNA polymerase III subunit beta n=1 Tax=Eubacterium sp. MSJ-33 TaxID=2841528 RepID=UPI001C771157|nr:DNA polymerase III subunit beta [Eubacterium sp. MSJ-33]QWT52267.1 DNA polymerase III subunit beta [Eubacterium sp. MSJ-33]
MKIKCSKTNLLNSLNIVSKAVSTKTTMPILECILIDVYADCIKLTANDLEIGIETVLEGEVIEMGRIAIEAKIFNDIVRKLPNSDIFIESTPDYRTIIRCEKSKFVISSKSGEDFTELPQIEKEKSIELSQFSLKEIIRQTIFSISDNENNKLMTGELFEVKDGVLQVVSLDGHRISLRNLALKGNASNVSVVVPGKTLNDLSKIITGGVDDMVTIYFTDRHILFEFDNTMVVSRLLEGEYFKIVQMLSMDHKIKVRVNNKELFDCIDRATILMRESDKKPIIVNIKDDMMYMKVDTMMGTMDEELDITKDGEEIIIGFNPKFLTDVLKVIDDEDIFIYMRDAKSPCIIRDDAGTYIYVVLPVNINAGAY